MAKPRPRRRSRRIMGMQALPAWGTLKSCHKSTDGGGSKHNFDLPDTQEAQCMQGASTLPCFYLVLTAFSVHTFIAFSPSSLPFMHRGMSPSERARDSFGSMTCLPCPRPQRKCFMAGYVHHRPPNFTTLAFTTRKLLTYSDTTGLS